MPNDEGKQDNTRFIITILSMVIVASVAMFFVARAERIDNEGNKINRDGISCVLEQLNSHRMNTFTANQQDAEHHGLQLRSLAPAAQPVPRELLKACERFYEAE